MTRKQTQVSRWRAQDAWRVPDSRNLPSPTRAIFLHCDGWRRISPSGLMGVRRWWLPGKERPLSFHCGGGGEDTRIRVGEDRVDCGGGGEKGGRSAGVDCWRRGVLALMAGWVWGNACKRTIAAAEQWCCGRLQ
jgi:hypothetical protein